MEYRPGDEAGHRSGEATRFIAAAADADLGQHGDKRALWQSGAGGQQHRGNTTGDGETGPRHMSKVDRLDVNFSGFSVSPTTGAGRTTLDGRRPTAPMQEDAAVWSVIRLSPVPHQPPARTFAQNAVAGDNADLRQSRGRTPAAVFTEIQIDRETPRPARPGRYPLKGSR